MSTSHAPFSYVGLAIRLLRSRASLTQGALAEIAIVTKSQVSKYEGGRQRPTLDTLDRIMTALGVDVFGLALALREVDVQGGEEARELGFGFQSTPPRGRRRRHCNPCAVSRLDGHFREPPGVFVGAWGSRRNGEGPARRLCSLWGSWCGESRRCLDVVLVGSNSIEVMGRVRSRILLIQAALCVVIVLGWAICGEGLTGIVLIGTIHPNWTDRYIPRGFAAPPLRRDRRPS